MTPRTLARIAVAGVLLAALAGPAAAKKKTPAAPPAASATPGGRLSVADVLALAAAGVREEVVVRQLRQTDSTFALSARDLIALKRGGVPDAVVEVMQLSTAAKEATTVTISGMTLPSPRYLIHYPQKSPLEPEFPHLPGENVTPPPPPTFPMPAAVQTPPANPVRPAAVGAADVRDAWDKVMRQANPPLPPLPGWVPPPEVAPMPREALSDDPHEIILQLLYQNETIGPIGGSVPRRLQGPRGERILGGIDDDPEVAPMPRVAGP